MRPRFLSSFEAYRSTDPFNRRFSARGGRLTSEQAKYGDDHSAGSISSTGKRTEYHINLRSVQENVVDRISRSASTTDILSNGRPRVNPEKFRDYRSGAEEVLQIVQTRHILEEEGNDTVVLTLRGNEEVKLGEEVPTDLRWIHINNNAMDFTAFQAYALNAPGLLNDDKALILRLLKKVRTLSERRWVHGRYFEPIAMRYTGKDPNLDTETKTALFCCLPYFSLDQYKHSNFTRDSFLHPTRTLLQSRYRLEATEKRDNQQVIRKLGRPEHDGIIHVPQLWCLIVNKNTIITCAPRGLTFLHGNSIKTIPYTESPAIDGPSCVRFTDLEGRLFFLPLEQCKTWFELIRKVLQVCPDLTSIPLDQLPEGYTFVNEHGQPVTDKNWRKIVDSERSAFVHLFMEWDSNLDEMNVDARSMSEMSSTMLDSSEGEVQNGRSRRKNNQDKNLAATNDEQYFQGEELSLPKILTRQKTVGFEGSPHTSRSLLSSDHSPPSLVAETLHGKKLPHDRFHGKSGGRDHLYSKTPDRNPGFQKDTFITRRERTPDLGARGSAMLEEVNWGNVDWEPKKPRRRRTEEQEPRSHQEFKLFRAPTLDRTGGRKHSEYQSRALRFYPESSRNPRLSRAIVHDDLSDIYWEPPSHHSSPMPPALVVDESPENQGPFGKKTRDDATLSNSNDTGPVRRSAPRPVSPHPLNAFVLPIFTWPTMSSPNVYTQVPSSRDPQSRSNLTVPELQGLPERPQSVQLNEQTLALILADAHDQVSDKKRKGYQHVYDDTPESTPQDVEAEVERLENDNVEEFNNRNENELTKSKFVSVKEKRQLFNQARKLSDAFVPANYRCSITGKYWGAIHSIVKAKQIPKRHHSRVNELQYMLGTILGFSEIVESIQAGVYAGSDPQSLQYRIPRSLVKAYQQLVMFFVYNGAIVGSAPSRDLEPKYLHSLRDECELCCRTFLIEGKYELILMIHTNDYRDGAGYEAVTSEALTALVMERLLDVSSRDGDFDLTEIYGEYLLKLEGMVQEHPSVRVFEDIKLLSEELEIIGKTLASQRMVLEDFCNLNNQSGYLEEPSAYFSNAVTGRCLDNIDQRISEFEELLIQALNTQFLAAQSISLKAESNNKAILIFTIVTIIFLPLSFVTSYLGMNTADIRTTASGQGLFWSIALPMTLLILSLAVLIAYQKPWMRQLAINSFSFELRKPD